MGTYRGLIMIAILIIAGIVVGMIFFTFLFLHVTAGTEVKS